jgi:hypothetical protein
MLKGCVSVKQETLERKEPERDKSVVKGKLYPNHVA